MAATTPAPCWLLLLGSSRPDDHCLRNALVQLAAFGPVQVLTPVTRFPSYTGEPDRWYFNALATIQSPWDRAGLHAALRAIEAALGRRRDVPGEVAIDLDILARRDAHGWHADAHALAKGDLAHPTTCALLRAAGIDVHAG